MPDIHFDTTDELLAFAGRMAARASCTSCRGPATVDTDDEGNITLTVDHVDGCAIAALTPSDKGRSAT